MEWLCLHLGKNNMTCHTLIYSYTCQLSCIMLSAAFDTVDHIILLRRLETSFGITDTALAWFSSYLSGCSQCVSINRETLDCYPLPFGVPQGSCLWPLLFSAYASKLFKVIKLYLPNAHAFTDDTQLYLSFNPDNSLNEAEAGHAMWNGVFAP